MSLRTQNASGTWPAPAGAASTREPEPASVFDELPTRCALPIPPSGPGITRLAHCLGGQLDDGGSGRTAGRHGGDDWRAFPSRQGDWLVYRDGRRVHISEAA